MSFTSHAIVSSSFCSFCARRLCVLCVCDVNCHRMIWFSSKQFYSRTFWIHLKICNNFFIVWPKWKRKPMLIMPSIMEVNHLRFLSLLFNKLLSNLDMTDSRFFSVFLFFCSCVYAFVLCCNNISFLLLKCIVHENMHSYQHTLFLLKNFVCVFKCRVRVNVKQRLLSIIW